MSSTELKLGIIGWPLGYSLSPLMHNAALKAAGLQGEYKEYPVKPEALEHWLETEAPKLDGFNVTMPHKESVFRWLASRGTLDSVAQVVGAVNTVSVKDGKLIGHNSDAEGFWAPLKERKSPFLLVKWQVLLLGAGGAARAIVSVLGLRAAAREMAVWSRTFQSAERLVEETKKIRTEMPASAVKDLNSIPVEKFDVIVNATPSGMRGEGEVPMVVTSRLRRGQIVYDLVYEPQETVLILAARKAGCKVITGDEMLAAQGAAAFEIWTGVRATKVLPAMKQALDEHFAKHAS